MVKRLRNFGYEVFNPFFPIMKKNKPSLDPENWDEMRTLLHRMVDDALDHLEGVRDRPIWQEMPREVVQRFEEMLPREPTDPAVVYDDFKKLVMPYPMGNTHPRFWAWYMGAGTLSGAIGDFWASVLNPNQGGGNHAANKVEEQVINWMKEIMGFPLDSSGLLVSGGSMANFVGLAVARNVHAGYDIRKHGLLSGSGGQMTVYASAEVHSCNQKALELLGLGAESLRKLPVGRDYRVDVAAVRTAISRDRASGKQPICIIGTPGTVNTGAIDDLNALADLAAEEGLWFHVDGAIGAIAMLAPSVKPQLSGIERADSVALDLHKWMHMPFEAGCVLVRHAAAHRDTFALMPAYLAKNARGVASGNLWFSEYGLQLSRRFRALKVWLSLKEHGAAKFGRMIEKNVRQAEYLADRIRDSEILELVAPPGLDIVCFRYNPGLAEEGRLNELNREIKLQLEEQNIALPGYTTLGDMYCLRIAIANHRTEITDLDDFLDKVVTLGTEILNA